MRLENEVVHSLAQKIAEALPGGFVYQKPDEYVGWYATIRNKDGKGLHISLVQGNVERLAISGYYPNPPRDFGGVAYNESTPEITVSATRPIEQIAKEIQRRLLPTYEVIFAKTQEGVQRENERKNKVASRLTALAAITGDTPKEGAFSICTGDVYGDVYTGSGDSFRVKLASLTYDQVKAILEIIAK